MPCVTKTPPVFPCGSTALLLIHAAQACIPALCVLITLSESRAAFQTCRIRVYVILREFTLEGGDAGPLDLRKFQEVHEAELKRLYEARKERLQAEAKLRNIPLKQLMPSGYSLNVPFLLHVRLFALGLSLTHKLCGQNHCRCWVIRIASIATFCTNIKAQTRTESLR
jgi:hypothetical protein